MNRFKSPILTGLAFLVLLVACEKPPITIKYILPDSYRGVLIVKRKSLRDLNSPSPSDAVTLEFPTNGVLWIDGKLPFSRWHQIEAVYNNGKSIPVMTVAGSVTPD